MDVFVEEAVVEVAAMEEEMVTATIKCFRKDNKCYRKIYFLLMKIKKSNGKSNFLTDYYESLSQA